MRFITLNDNFFERIGVDFDFNITTTKRPNDPAAIAPSNKKDNRRFVAPGGRNAVPELYQRRVSTFPSAR